MCYFSPGICTSNVSHCCRDFNAINVSLFSYNTLFILLWSFQINTHTQNTAMIGVKEGMKNASTPKDKVLVLLFLGQKNRRSFKNQKHVSESHQENGISRKVSFYKILQQHQFSINSVRRELAFEPLVLPFAYQGLPCHGTSTFKFVSQFWNQQQQQQGVLLQKKKKIITIYNVSRQRFWLKSDILVKVLIFSFKVSIKICSTRRTFSLLGFLRCKTFKSTQNRKQKLFHPTCKLVRPFSPWKKSVVFITEIKRKIRHL